MSDARATYAQDKDRITVMNECGVADGRFDSARGFAHVVERSGTARLRASFFRPFQVDYLPDALSGIRAA